jgi:hypothetical protein
MNDELKSKSFHFGVHHPYFIVSRKVTFES